MFSLHKKDLQEIWWIRLIFKSNLVFEITQSGMFPTPFSCTATRTKFVNETNLN